jgi:hypothetical protein
MMRMRSLACLSLSLLAGCAHPPPAPQTSPSPVLAPSSPAPAPAALPACLHQVSARLAGAVTTTTIAGRAIRGKRLVVRRGDVTLVLDHATFEATTRAFLAENGDDRFPEEKSLLARFAEGLDRTHELEADPIVSTDRLRDRFDYRLAEVLERGEFELRPATPSTAERPTVNGPGVLLRLEYSHHCGNLCGSGGRVFVTDACQTVVEVMDWIS